MAIKSLEQLTQDIKVSLGYPSIDLELEDAHYTWAINRALDLYHKFAYGTAIVKDYLALSAVSGTSAYDVPSGVMAVIDHYYGYDPMIGNISQLFTFENIMWNAGALNVWNWGHFGLITYHLSMQYLDLLRQMIPSKYFIVYERETNRVVVRPTPASDTYLYLEVYNSIAASALYDQPWIFEWARAECMEILANIRGKYAGLPGPGGQMALNANVLMQQAISEKERLRQDLLVTESEPMLWTIG